MHEMGIALEIIKIATASIPNNLKCSKIVKINVKIGKLSAIASESLRFCFNVASENTPVANAELSIKITPVIIKCKKCSIQYEINKPAFKCKKCSTGNIKVISGTELDICSVEIENKEDNEHPCNKQS